MALQMTYSLKGDYPITAYIRIKDIHIQLAPETAATLAANGWGSGNKYVGVITLEVKPSKNKNPQEIIDGFYRFAYDHTTNSNPIQQGYNFLKTQPEFVVTTDIND